MTAQYQASIIVPVLRQVDAWLAQAVDSALTQTVRCEVIVVTAPDTPPSNLAVLEAAAAGRHALRLITRQPRGFAAAINTGIHAAATQRIGLLLSDDWLEPRAIEHCLTFAADIVSTNNTKFDADGTTAFENTRRRFSIDEYDRLATLEQKADYLRHFFLFQKDALLAVNGVDETIGLTGPDDYDLIWTMLERGASVGIVEQSLYNKRDHAGDRLTMRDPEAQVNDLRKIFDKHGIHGAQRQRLIELKSRWFGKPVHMVATHQSATAARIPATWKRRVRRLLGPRGVPRSGNHDDVA